jgi:cytochrome c oxidase assembly protein subunit 15
LGAIFLVLLLMGARILPVYILLAALALVAIAFSLNRILRQPGTLRWWGILAFAAVILQGVLGGLRVVWFKDQIGIFHAALAQLFFALVCLIAFFTRTAGARPSPGAANSVRTIAPEYSNDKVSGVIAAPGDGRAPLRSLRQLFLTATLLILCQLILGATMRHQHAGLAIPDFPLAYGKVWPAMNAGSIAQYNQQRLETVALNPITAFGVGLQMAHRLTALMICVLVAGCGWLAWRQLGARHRVTKVAFLWLGLILVQGLLGAATIWSNKAADIATAHVITGALTLALGTLLCAVCSRGVVVAREPAPALTPALFGAQPSAAHAFD